MLWWDILLQFADSPQLSVTGLHFPLTFECQCGGRSTHPETSLAIFKGRGGGWKIMQWRKEDERKIHQTFLVPVVSGPLWMPRRDVTSKFMGWGWAGNLVFFSGWEGDSWLRQTEKAQHFAWRFPQCLELTSTVSPCLENAMCKWSIHGTAAPLTSSGQPVALHASLWTHPPQSSLGFTFALLLLQSTCPERKILRGAGSEVRGRAGGKAIVALIILWDLLHSKEIVGHLAFPTALATVRL